jgi:hypothetical protein
MDMMTQALQPPPNPTQTSNRAMQQEAATGKVVEGLVMDNITRHVRSCFEQAIMAKTKITERLLKCERQRRGEYDPEHAAAIRQTGGSDIFMMLTDIKCRAAESWIKDVMMNARERSWGLDPTPVPDLPEQMRQEVIETVVQEAMQVQQAGLPVHPQSIALRMDEIYKEVNEAMSKRARCAADAMEQRIADILAEANYLDTYGEVIHDFVTYPTCILKGPMVRKRKGLSWGAGFTPVVTDTLGRDYYRVSPYDAFPAPNATGCDDEFFIERMRLNRRDLQAMIGMPGNNDANIKEALDLYGRNGLRNWRQGDNEHERLEGKDTVLQSVGTIECLEFWGQISGQMLADWGMKKVDPYTDYDCNVWVIGPYTVRCVVNADPLGRRPYEVASFIKIPGAFWGTGLPESMRDVQLMCNAAARALANNMAIASGPQVEVVVDRLPQGESVTQMFPWKIWQTTSDKSGGGQPAVKFFQPNMNADQLMAIYQYFQKVADEVTGVPNYVYGSSNVSGAGRTASGLSMLMENAAKGIKHAILSLDRAQSNMLRRTFEHLMIYDSDQSIKGDMKVVPRGVVATLIKDGVQERRQQFLASTANPIDAQIMGIKGRANVLRRIADGLDMDGAEVVPSEEELEQLQQQQQQQQAQQQQMQLQQHQAQMAQAAAKAAPAPSGAVA